MPPHHASAAILSVGDELLLGQTLDTNSQWLAARLRDLGILCTHFAAVPDDAQSHAAELVRLAAAADLVICTGGLGPTADDLTRAALAAALNEPLVEDPIALAQVEAFFAARSRAMPAINRVQALCPSSGRTLPNLHGTAPGLYAALHTADIFCLPGPPAEMKPMFESQVLPRLRPPPGRTVRTRALHCVGIGESDLATRLGELMERARVPLVGTTASGGIVSIRLRYEGPLPTAQADELLDASERDIRARAEPFVFGIDNDRLPAVILNLLKARTQTLGCVESCTGGLLSAALTDLPGASAVFRGGLTLYSNDLKSALADVEPAILHEHGAVSPQCALALAVGGLTRLHCDHALSITGIAGPDGALPARGPTPAKPVGTVFIAHAARDQPPHVRRFDFPGDRHAVRAWAVLSALAILRARLLSLPHTPLLREVAP